MNQLCPRQAQSHLINMQSQRRETGDFRDYRRNRRGLGRSQETSKIVNARNIASKSTQPGLRKLARLSKFRASFPSHFPTASRIILPPARPQRRTCDSAGGRTDEHADRDGLDRTCRSASSCFETEMQREDHTLLATSEISEIILTLLPGSFEACTSPFL